MLLTTERAPLLRGILLFLLPIVLWSCHYTGYGDFPMAEAEQQPLPKHEYPVFYEVTYAGKHDPYITRGTQERSARLMREVVEDLFSGRGSFPNARRVFLTPSEGTFCRVNIQLGKRALQQSHVAVTYLFALTLTVVPAPKPFAYQLEYALYRDGRLLKTYRYEVEATEYVSPFGFLYAWMNLFVNEKDVFRATTYQFLIDAERDGYLEQS